MLKGLALSASVAALAIATAASAASPPAKPRYPVASGHRPVVETAENLRDRAASGDNIALDFVRELTTRFGPRPAGSHNEQAAAAWAADRMKALGFSNVHVEEFPLTGWTRGFEHAELTTRDGVTQPLAAVALGETPGTPPEGVEGEVVVFDSLEALQDASDGSLAGKVAMVDRKMVRMQDGSGYGPISLIRALGPGEAAKKGAVAFLLREAGTDHHRLGHTGTTRYVEGKVAIPAFAISNIDADQIDRLAALGGPVRVRLFSGASYNRETHSQNVVAEIKGRDRPDEVVLIGAHMDSWDQGTGAIDDGVGDAIIAAAAKLILELPERPSRTIRIVFYGSEEVAQPEAPFGAFGGNAYLARRKDEVASHIAAGESDFGSDRIYALNLPKGTMGSAFARTAGKVLMPLGITVSSDASSEGGTDVGPTIEAGAPAIELRQDGSRYFDLHHTADDTFDKIDPAQLNQNVAAWAAMLWLIADSDVDFRAMAAKAEAPAK